MFIKRLYKISVLTSTLILASPLCYSETLSQLITDARVLAKDASSSTRQRFTDANITELLNQAQRDANSATNCVLRSYNFTLSAGTTYYPLPSTFNSITRVTRGKYGAMQELSPAALDSRTRGWETASGSPTYYFINFSSRGLLGFAPFPGTTSDTDTVKIEYFAQLTDMSASTDQPFNSISELSDSGHHLAYYAASVMSAIDGNQAQSAMYIQLYQSGIAVMKSACKDRPNYLPSASASP